MNTDARNVLTSRKSSKEWGKDPKGLGVSDVGQVK